jgi:DNA-binding transcriptional regulator GbsR (MarR family)
MSVETRFEMIRKLILQVLRKNKDGLTFSELVKNVGFSQENISEVLYELVYYSPLVTIKEEKYYCIN